METKQIPAWQEQASSSLPSTGAGARHGGLALQWAEGQGVTGVDTWPPHLGVV